MKLKNLLRTTQLLILLVISFIANAQDIDVSNGTIYGPLTETERDLIPLGLDDKAIVNNKTSGDIEYWDGNQWLSIGTGDGEPFIKVTQAQYDALTQTEIDNNNYIIVEETNTSTTDVGDFMLKVDYDNDGNGQVNIAETLNGYSESTSAFANVIVRRDATGNINLPPDTYDSDWAFSNVAAPKNAIYNKIESFIAAAGGDMTKSVYDLDEDNAIDNTDTNSVNSASIVDGSIQNVDIGPAQVTRSRIEDFAADRIAGRSGTSGTLEELTPVQAKAILSYQADEIAFVDNSTHLNYNNIDAALEALASRINNIDSDLDGLVNGVENNSITSGKILNGSVASDDLASNSVSTIKIQNDAVNDSKLSHTGVSAGTYNNANVTVNAQGRVTSISSGSGLTIESNTFIPVLEAGSGTPYTYTARGYYQKIGDVVTVWIQFTNINGSAASGNLEVTGLPYNANVTQYTNEQQMFPYFISGTTSGFITDPIGEVSSNTLRLRNQDGNTNTGNSGVDFSGNGNIIINMTYISN